MDWPPTDELKPRFRDPRYALAFARIVTHYALNYAWLEDRALLDGTDKIAGLRVMLIVGQDDHQSHSSQALSERLPLSQRIVVEDASHAAGGTGIETALVRATDMFVGR